MTETLRMKALDAAIKTCGESNAETVLYAAGRYLSFLTNDADRATASEAGDGVGSGDKVATQMYLVAAIVAGEERPPHGEAIFFRNDLSTKDAFNHVKWDEVEGAEAYIVYRANPMRTAFGYIGKTLSPQFVDDNVAPDWSRAPVDALAV